MNVRVFAPFDFDRIQMELDELSLKMASTRTCMNVACSTSTSIQWRKGWDLRSGEFADLCDKCG